MKRQRSHMEGNVSFKICLVRCVAVIAVTLYSRPFDPKAARHNSSRSRWQAGLILHG
jgi:hypothetical protein